MLEYFLFFILLKQILLILFVLEVILIIDVYIFYKLNVLFYGLIEIIEGITFLILFYFVLHIIIKLAYFF
jgi:hypothetical protein